jgi:hypothetical protein
MTIIRTPNKYARQYVQTRRNFIGSNIKGHWEPSEVYAVYSYGYHFPIWVYDENGGWFGNTDKYSPTTTRQQTQTYPDTDDIHWLHTDALLRLVKLGFKQVLINRVMYGERYD